MVLRKTYMQALRMAYGEDFSTVADPDSMLNNAKLLAQCRVVDVSLLHSSVRTKFYGRLVASSPEASKTLLTATLDIQGSFAEALRQDMQDLRTCTKLRQMPDFAQDPHAWFDFTERYPAEYRDIVDIHVEERRIRAGSNSLDTPLAEDVAEPQAEPLGEIPRARTDWYLPLRCQECDLTFASSQARGVHRRKVHL